MPDPILTDLPHGVRVDVPDLEASKARALYRQTVEAFLRTAQAQFRTVDNATNRTRQDQLEDVRFSYGTGPGGKSYQWPDTVLTDRNVPGGERPCLTINRLDQPIKQITNQQRASRPQIQVNPVDGAADVQTAEVLQGLIRRIELQSDADVIYANAGDRQVRSGIAYWRVLTEWVDGTFEQEIYIRRIRNPFTVYVDPACAQPDFSDARYAFIVEDIPTAEYRQRYPGTQMASLTSFETLGDRKPDWAPEGSVRVAEYFYVDTVEDQLALVRTIDGSEHQISGSELQEIPMKFQPPPQQGVAWRLWTPQHSDGPLVVQVLRQRPDQKRIVKRAVINAVEILEGNAEKTAGERIVGKHIPIAVVVGEEIDLDGKVDFRGLVRGARDPQRMLNYWSSAITELIALAPKIPYIGYEGQFKGHELKWRTMNRQNYPYLEIVPITIGGQPAPFPQRQVAEQPIQAMVVALNQAEANLRAVTGYVDVQSREGMRRETSGRAILARQQQSEVGNSNYLENLGFAIRHTGRIVLAMIPEVYTSLQVRRYLGPDEQEMEAAVHAGGMPPGMSVEQIQQLQQAGKLPKTKTPIDQIFDLSVGRYDVTISVGPSYQSKRQQAVESMVQLVQSNPQIFQVIGDLMVKNMDWPGAKDISDRLQKMLPPELKSEPDGSAGQGPDPAQLQQQMSQMSQQMEQMQAQLQQAQQILQTKQIEAERAIQIKQMELAAEERWKQMELAAKEREQQWKRQQDLVLAQIKVEGQRAEAIVKGEIDRMQEAMRLDAQARMGQQERFEEAMLHPEPVL